MFKNIRDFLNKNLPNVPQVDPSVFNDAVAMKTSWNPLTGCSADVLQKNKWVVVSPDRAEFRVTIEYKLFCGLFALCGPMLLITCFPRSEWYLLVSEFLLAVISVFLFWTSTRPLVFDKKSGFFIKNDLIEKYFFCRRQQGSGAPLGRVYALQLIFQYHSGGGVGGMPPFYSYQLNIVLDDASRVSVINNGNQSKTREEAKQLAQFLQKPLWDAS